MTHPKEIAVDPLAYMRRRIDQGDSPADAERSARKLYGGSDRYIGTGRPRGRSPGNRPGILRHKAADLRRKGG